MKPEYPLPWLPSPGHNRPEKECSFILGWPTQHRRGPKEPGWKVCTLSPLAGLYMFEQALGSKYGEGPPPSFMGGYTRPTQALGSPAIYALSALPWVASTKPKSPWEPGQEG